nr:hypothetical protein [Ruegeria arenilitoris]
MKFELPPGLDAQKIDAPVATIDVPKGFLQALRRAKQFVGSHSKSFPAGTFVHIAEDKLYASNNRHLVEFEIGAKIGTARLAKSDIDVLSGMGDEPNKLVISDNKVSFTWSDGRWVIFQTEPVAFDWSEEFKKRIDAYWVEGRPTVVPTKKSVDAHLKPSRKEPVAFDLPHGENGRTGRVVVFPKGIFFRKGKSGISGLIDDGTFDPRIDDVFAEAIEETKVAKKAKEKQIERLITRIEAIKTQIENLTTEGEELDRKLVAQHDGVAKYQSGEDLDETERAILTPVCAELSSMSRNNEVEAEFDQHEDAIPNQNVCDRECPGQAVFHFIQRDGLPGQVDLIPIQRASVQ